MLLVEKSACNTDDNEMVKQCSMDPQGQGESSHFPFVTFSGCDVCGCISEAICFAGQVLRLSPIKPSLCTKSMK